MVVHTRQQGDILIGLPLEAQLMQIGTKRGLAEVIYESRFDLQVEVATIRGNGTRVITVINGPEAPTSYTYALEIPKNVRLVTKKK
ncbi:hypothetical protein [Candidatus Poriferisocius sp.]|uniref:hypothetical protein n=1 Tax=Candidatus Poriferisocius sp. TaxID=3101276 RepID=UPI003B02A793